MAESPARNKRIVPITVLLRFERDAGAVPPETVVREVGSGVEVEGILCAVGGCAGGCVGGDSGQDISGNSREEIGFRHAGLNSRMSEDVVLKRMNSSRDFSGQSKPEGRIGIDLRCVRKKRLESNIEPRSNIYRGRNAIVLAWSGEPVIRKWRFEAKLNKLLVGSFNSRS